MTKTQKLSIRFLKFLFIVIFVITFIIRAQPDTPDEKIKKLQKFHEKNVRIACIVEIQKRLKYPDSMKIMDRGVLSIGENKWMAEIRVRAKNNFNTMVPLNFICDVCLENNEYKLKGIRGD